MKKNWLQILSLALLRLEDEEELKQHPASFSSLPGSGPAASSASLSRRFRSRKTPKDFPASKNGR